MVLITTGIESGYLPETIEKVTEMEKEKLRLEIKLLQSKVMEDSNDVSHYIFVP